MDTETKLLKYKKEIDEVEKEIQKSKGILETLTNALKKDLDVNIDDSEKLMKHAKKQLNKLEKEIEKEEREIDELLETIEKQYELYEEQID